MRSVISTLQGYKTESGKWLKLADKFKKDEDGAALIEYTVLLGILVVAVIAIIAAVGGWVNSQWASLNTKLN